MTEAIHFQACLALMEVASSSRSHVLLNYYREQTPFLVSLTMARIYEFHLGPWLILSPNSRSFIAIGEKLDPGQ